MGAPDDSPVSAGDRAVAVQVLELDPAGARAVVPERGGIERVFVVAVRHQAVKRTDRLAEHVDHGILFPQRDRPGEGLRPEVVDLEDLVRIVAAVEAHAPQGSRAGAAAVADGKIDALVSHPPDVDDRGSG